MVARKVVWRAVLAFLPIVGAGIATHWVYRRPATAYVDFERGYERAFVSGFHDHEKMQGRGFRWTSRDAFVRVENLPRRSRLRIEVRIKGLRPQGVPLPHVRFTANGATVFETVCAPGLVAYRFGVTSPRSSLELGIHPDIFVPADSGRDDARVLGVQVFSVRIEAQGGEPETARPVGWMMVAGVAVLGAAWLAGLSLPWSALAAAAFLAGFVYLLNQDSVRFLPYSRSVALTAFAALVLSAVLRGWSSRLGWLHPSERRIVIAVVVGTFLLKMSALFFPLFVSSDADFQANRLLNVMEGDFFTTSVTQHDPPFRIPYPVSLYLLAAPWAAAGLDRVAVLAALTALFDISIGLALVFLARRFLADTRAGILAAVVYQMVPVNFLAFSAGNFTNLFGVAALTLFVTLFLAARANGKTSSTAAAAAFLLLALTAHFGTFLYGMLLWPVLLLAVRWLAPPEMTTPRSRNLLTGLVVAGAVLSLLYYSGYKELFLSQWHRLLDQEYATGDVAVQGPLAKLAFNLHFYREQVGVVFGLVALLGGISVLRSPADSGLHAAAAAWTAVTAVFFVLDLTTSLEVRYLLQVMPLLSLFGGVYLSGALERGRIGKLAAAVIVVYLVAAGLENIRECIFFNYH